MKLIDRLLMIAAQSAGNDRLIHAMIRYDEDTSSYSVCFTLWDGIRGGNVKHWTTYHNTPEQVNDEIEQVEQKYHSKGDLPIIDLCPRLNRSIERLEGAV